ncbi:MAG TPA: SAM-dependent methyltransferase, partial [Verrucomicrobiae bacterium]|nr:SAM-dependent methyltransferase [Verrucomicrobiae bacterium]
TIDVAFISLDKILPAVWNVIKPTGQVVALIKPQFEAGKEKVGKNGVVKDPLVHREVIQRVLESAESIGFKVLGLEYSPIKGPEGNIEYLAWLGKTAASSIDWQALAGKVVANSHSQWEKQEIR